MSQLAYSYLPPTGEYVDTIECQPSPRESGVYLIPANATILEPPQAKEHEVAVFENSAWTIRPDWRGFQYWLADGSEHKITEIGIAPPNDALNAPPPPTLDVRAAEQRAQRDALIATTDWFVLRHRDEMEINHKTALTVEQFNSVLAYRQALRNVPQQEGFPDQIEWPELPESVTQRVSSANTAQVLAVNRKGR